MFVLYQAKISGERFQDHWSSGIPCSSLKFCFIMYFDIQAGGHYCITVMYVIFIFSSSYLLNFFDPAG